MSWIPPWVLKILPYVIGLILVILLVGGCIWKYDTDVKKARSEGYDSGVSFQQDLDQKAIAKERKDHEDEKKRIEGEAQGRIDSANRDRDIALSQLDGLHKELDRIREIGQRYTGPQSSGTSTGEIINMLADLYEASERDYNDTAAEADKYYNAGLTCEIQYDSLKVKYDKAKSSQAAN